MATASWDVIDISIAPSATDGALTMGTAAVAGVCVTNIYSGRAPARLQ